MNEQNFDRYNTYPVNEDRDNWLDETELVEEIRLPDLETNLPLDDNLASNSEVAQMATKLDELISYLSELKQQFSDRFERDTAKEKAFEYLYDELETAKQDSNFERFKPLEKT